MEELRCDAHSLIADIALLAKDQVLLVRYTRTNKYDLQPGWFLPDDVLQHLEHPEKAAARIAREQLGIAADDARLSHVESFEGNDGSWHIAFHGVVSFEEPPPITPSVELEESAWFPLGKLPERSRVAHHGWALDTLAEIARRRR